MEYPFFSRPSDIGLVTVHTPCQNSSKNETENVATMLVLGSL